MSINNNSINHHTTTTSTAVYRISYTSAITIPTSRSSTTNWASGYRTRLGKAGTSATKKYCKLYHWLTTTRTNKWVSDGSLITSHTSLAWWIGSQFPVMSAYSTWKSGRMALRTSTTATTTNSSVLSTNYCTQNHRMNQIHGGKNNDSCIGGINQCMHRYKVKIL